MDGLSDQGSPGVEMFLPNYRLGKTLGIGTFGKVKIAEHILIGHKVAIKILNRSKIKDKGMEENVRREIKIMRLLMHPHIIRLYEVIETPMDICFVMEYVSSGELFDYIVEKGRLMEDEARRFFQQIISGVEYCHRNMVVHRDLKPENLLLDSRLNIKIADFGLSNVMRDGHFLKTSCGSPNYAAPEVVSGKLYTGTEVDIWSCGVVLHAILCGSLPFDIENLAMLFELIKAGAYTLPMFLSPNARDLISRMLQVDPTRRITILEIREHPWFRAYLPRYLAVPPPDTMHQAKKIDKKILQVLVNIGFDRNRLVEALHNRVQNDGTVTYYLLLDNHIQAISGYLGAGYRESLEYYSFDLMNPSEACTSSASQHLPEFMDYQGMGVQSQFPGKTKWSLGLQCHARPCELMMQILNALRELNVCWKKIGHYNMKCKWVPCIPGCYERFPVHMSSYFGGEPSTENYGVLQSANVVKFEIQIYKTGDKYQLDLQRFQGPPLLFMELCVVLFAKLGAF